MSKVIEKYNRCVSSDLRTDESIYGEKGVDFLMTFRQVENIVTNPPYILASEFVERALVCASEKVAMLLKLVFLEGIGRYGLFKNTPLKKVWVFCRRQRIYKLGETGKNSGLIAYAWFIWDKSYDGEPTIDWIP